LMNGTTKRKADSAKVRRALGILLALASKGRSSQSSSPVGK